MGKHDDELRTTSLEIDPDEDPRGSLSLSTPEGASLADDTEDDEAYEALLEDLSPGEAARVVATMRPLSKDEEDILDEFPSRDLSRVDDAENTDRIIDLSSRGYHAMDDVLRDAIYGDDMTTPEENMERTGHDSKIGWGIPGISRLKKLAKGAYRGAKRGIKAPLRGARWAAKKAGRGLMRFVPRRDAGKAKVVKNFYSKITREHANWLADQDRRSGRPSLPRSSYVATSREWARQQMQKGGLPTSFKVSGADVLGADLLGADVVGSWWNPLSWFVTKVKVVDQSTAAERLPGDPSLDPSIDPTAQDYGQSPEASDAYSEPASGYPGSPDYGDYPGEAEDSSGSAEDSLCGFSDEVLAGFEASPPPKKQRSKPDELVDVAVAKLRSGNSLSAGELAVLATLAKGGHARAKRVYSVLMRKGSADLGYWKAWTHKMNPLYWVLKTSEERKLIDAEKNRWKENAELQKDLRRRQETLEHAEKAKRAKEAVEAAKEQAVATEAQLKAVKTAVSGAFVGSAVAGSVGHEKPMAVNRVAANALQKAGLYERASEMWSKVVAGKPLDESEQEDAKKISRVLTKTKVVHGDEWRREGSQPELDALHGAFVGACVLGEVAAARAVNQRVARVAAAIGKRPFGAREARALRAVAKSTAKVQGCARKYLRAGALRSVEGGPEAVRAAQVGAALGTMRPAEKKMIEAIRNLAHAGNPRAQKSLAALKRSGHSVGGDFVGFSIAKAFKYATAPVWLPAKGIYKATKWTGKKLGIVSSKKSPQDARLARMRAASKRRAAAEARARAADAQTEAELRAQQSIARAADAEADAADAQALQQEASMRTAEAEADPSALDPEDTSGAFVGSWESYVGAGRKKLVKKAAERSPTGTKIRSGASLYAGVKAGDPKARAALKVLIAKAGKGDQQATRDLRSVWAGREASRAKQKAQKRQVKALARRTRKLKVVAAQRRLEARLANKLVRAEKRHELRKLVKVERRAAAGDKKARSYVAKQVALAKKGDGRAKERVKKLRLAKTVRKAAPTRRERRNLVAARKLVVRAQRGNPKAVRQVLVYQAAAKSGNPNAKRAVQRLRLAASLEKAVVPGIVVASRKKRKTSNVEAVAAAKAKLATGTASREELLAGAKAARAMGDDRTAGILARSASQAPSATETLKRTAAVVAAKQSGDASAKDAVKTNFEAARAGDPEAIARTGKVVAVQTIDDVKQGRPVPLAMRDAVNLNERASAGDPAAADQVRRIAKAATSESPSPEATAAAVTLSAAAITAKAMASRPAAKQEFVEKVNAVPKEERPASEARLAELSQKAEDGTITPIEGREGVKLAERLGKPKVAAEIAAKAPPLTDDTPLSSLPDQPLRPINGPLMLAREVVKALTLSTRDPIANWREGVRSMSRTSVTTSGWSPFDLFASPVSTIVKQVAKLADRKRPARPSAAPTAPASPAARQPPPRREPEPPADASGDDRTPKDILSDAVQSKKISRRDLGRAVDLQVGPQAAQQVRKAVEDKIRRHLADRGVSVQ
jgi:hypothetical protein